MRILIEEYQYDVAVIKPVLHGIDALESVEGKVSVHYVGYYYNTLLRDCVFILPKVLLKDVTGQELVFGKYRPEDIIDPSKKDLLDIEEREFLYKFSVWIYRAIVVYKNDKRQDTDIVYHVNFAQVGNGQRKLSNTYLDILLSLVQFNRDNQNFFFFILKNLHSGYNKINWTRTIATQPAIVQDGRPLYLNPVNKRRQINFDEELIIIYFSILHYIAETYGFRTNIAARFQLITGAKFESYLHGMGLTRLRQIKYKYFSDKALELWKLCYAFFDESNRVYVNVEHREYLMVKNFYIVFEAIIDELIGDNPLPDGMQKKQDDGKIVDHLFTAESLIKGDTPERRQTYYIGDSKYYKIGHELGHEAVYKQYTYARNVIQHNLGIWRDNPDVPHDVRLRDEQTEGYNIIPNFFISAKMDERFDYGNDGIEKTDRTKQRHKQSHWPNRLFDRDTMLLFHYDVNFLFVLSLYARNRASDKAAWKTKVRTRFRDEIRQWLQDDFNFFAMQAHPHVDGEAYIRDHFKELIGKLYTPFAEKKIYSLALEYEDKVGKKLGQENEAMLTELRKYFFVEQCNLGLNPTDRLAPAVAQGGHGKYGDDSPVLLVGFTKDIKAVDDHRYYYIPAVRNGKSMEIHPDMVNVKYLLLHTHYMADGERFERRRFYQVKQGAEFVTGAQLLAQGFHTNDKLEYREKVAQNMYIGYHLGEIIPQKNDILNVSAVSLSVDKINIKPHFRTIKNPDL